AQVDLGEVRAEQREQHGRAAEREGDGEADEQEPDDDGEHPQAQHQASPFPASPAAPGPDPVWLPAGPLTPPAVPSTAVGAGGASCTLPEPFLPARKAALRIVSESPCRISMAKAMMMTVFRG